MSLNSKQRQALKAKAHALKPVVMIGEKGLTDAVINEANQALLAHELIKIKIAGHERDERQQAAQALAEQLQAELVQVIGNIVVVFRQNPNT